MTDFWKVHQYSRDRTGPYRIDLEIRRSGTKQPIKASFVYRHAVFSMQPRP